MSTAVPVPIVLPAVDDLARADGRSRRQRRVGRTAQRGRRGGAQVDLRGLRDRHRVHGRHALGHDGRLRDVLRRDDRRDLVHLDLLRVHLRAPPARPRSGSRSGAPWPGPGARSPCSAARPAPWARAPALDHGLGNRLGRGLLALGDRLGRLLLDQLDRQDLLADRGRHPGQPEQERQQRRRGAARRRSPDLSASARLAAASSSHAREGLADDRSRTRRGAERRADQTALHGRLSRLACRKPRGWVLMPRASSIALSGCATSRSVAATTRSPLSALALRPHASAISCR